MAIRRPSATFDVETLTYSLAEAALRFPCSERWLTDQIRSGRFSAHKIGGHWRMTDEDIEYALEQCRNSAILIRLLDDLLWMYSRNQTHPGGLETAVDAMIAEYTANPDHYSDGSPIGGEYIPDYPGNVIAWGPLPPPHRRAAD